MNQIIENNILIDHFKKKQIMQMKRGNSSHDIHAGHGRRANNIRHGPLDFPQRKPEGYTTRYG